MAIFVPSHLGRFVTHWLGRKQTTSVCLGLGGPSQHTQQQKAQGVQKGPAQQRRCEKRMHAMATQGGSQSATAEATATEDTTEKLKHMLNKSLLV